MKARTKKILIVVALCLASFSVGRWLRFRSVQGGQLASEISLAREEVEQISEELGLASSSTGSAALTGSAILEGIKELRAANSSADEYHTFILQSIERAQKLQEEMSDAADSYASVIDYQLDLAIKQSREYERMLTEMQRLEDR